MKPTSKFLKGILDGLPIGVGYLAVSFAFGLMAVEYGLSPLEALLISMTNLTSAGQLAAVPIIAGGGSFIELALTQLIINSRYALMSVALSQKLDKKVKLWHRFIIAFGNTDEIFAISMSQKESVGKVYFFGLMLTPWLGWSLGTILGALAGAALPAIITTSLNIAIYAMLISIFVPKAKEHLPTALCVLISVAISCAFKYLPLLATFAQNYSGFVIIICAVVSSALFALLFPIKTEEEVEQNVN